MAGKIPEHWGKVTWEEKARENPLLAVMTTKEMEEAAPSDFDPERLDIFFKKGRSLFDQHLRPLLSRLKEPANETFVVEYGCGVGRVLKAVVEAGYRCAGIDISATMIEHCRRQVSNVDALYVLDAESRCTAPSASASLVYSYAVVQHIALLSNYLTAFDEMCRILKPGGILGVQLNCKDFETGPFASPGRTENFETYSLHAFTPDGPAMKRHDQDQWSGVYIGHERLTAFLAERGVFLERWTSHNPKKPRAVWAIARKLQ